MLVNMLCQLLLLVPSPVAETRKLIISPQAVPVPAFRYQLLPPLKEKTTGNAVQGYYRCFSPDALSWFLRDKFDGRAYKWLELPYEEACKKGRPSSHPSHQQKKDDDDDSDGMVAATWEELAGILKYKLLDDLDSAARKTHAEWEYLEKIKKDGVYLLLPDLGGFRYLSSIVQIKARLLLMEGNFARSLYTLQSGMAMAQHLNATNLMMGTLYGNAFSKGMIKVLFEWVERPESPNLYWALSDLPQPLHPLRNAFEGDRMAIRHMVGDWVQFQDRILSQEEVRKLFEEKLMPALRMHGKTQSTDLTLMIMRDYPQAKAWLKEKGRSAEDIERMPATQAVLLYAQARYDVLADEYQKIFSLPPAQRLQHAEAIGKQQAHQQQDLGYYLGTSYIPSYPNIWLSVTEADRDIAVLRCVEALRHYAAGHDKKLPASWDDIRDLPIPVDPVTGERFGYQLVNGSAVITLQSIKTERTWRNSKVYEITLK